MAVYSRRIMETLVVSLDSIARQYFDRMPIILSNDEFVLAFVREDHVPKLKEVQELVGNVGRMGTTTKLSVTGEGVEGSMNCNINFASSTPPVLLPNYIMHGLSPDCPGPIREKIESWADERVKLGFMFGDAMDALEYLNGVCPDARTLSTLLPCFPIIMSNVSDDAESPAAKRAQKLAHNRSVGRMPKLPREVKDRLQEISSVVSSFSLMRDSPIPQLPKGHAVLTRTQYGDQPVRNNIFFNEDPNAPVAQRASFL